MATDITYVRLDLENAHMLEGADVFDNAVDPDQLKRFAADDGHELVFAVHNDAVVGFVSGTVLLHPDKPPAMFLNEVDVTPEFQQRGIGTSLCEHLLSIARSRGCKGIWLATEESNTAARALYRKLQARETGQIVVYDWDGAMDA
ncbi:MAG: GNAT family N-acetyltransferase [Pseudomonadota bacterium]